MGNETLEAEELLVEEAKADPTHFEALYERYFQEIFRFVFKRVNDAEITRDISQQVFLKALLHLKAYENRGFPFSSYLYRIAVNECNQYFRDSNKVRYVTMESIDSAQIPMDFSIEESQLDFKLTALKNTLQKLSHEDLLLIELRFFEKNSFKEIAFLLNISENLSKVRTYRLLKKLKKMIENG